MATFTATELTALRDQINQKFKEQVVPEYANRDLADEYKFLMRSIDDMLATPNEEFADEAKETLLSDAQFYIDRYYNNLLTPANAKVGEGATVCLYSDRHAYTIVKKSKTGKKLTLRRCRAILDKSFEPQFIAGGFAGHCTNQDEQTYTYEENENGEVVTAYWSDKWKGYYSDNSHVVKGRREFYDYNF